MVYFNEYNKKSHNDFPSPFFSLLKVQIFSFGEVKKIRRGSMESGDTGKIPIFEKLSSF